MSVKMEYKCDLCREVSPPEILKCIYYDSTVKNSDNSFGNYIIVSDIRTTDKHICKHCIEMIKSYKPD